MCFKYSKEVKEKLRKELEKPGGITTDLAVKILEEEMEITNEEAQDFIKKNRAREVLRNLDGVSVIPESTGAQAYKARLALTKRELHQKADEERYKVKQAKVRRKNIIEMIREKIKNKFRRDRKVGQTTIVAESEMIYQVEQETQQEQQVSTL